MALISYLVYCKTTKRTILPWKINSVSVPSITFRQFYEDDVVAKYTMYDTSCNLRELNCVFVGKSKEDVDEVDCNLQILSVCHTFGPYVKFIVEEIGESPIDGE